MGNRGQTAAVTDGIESDNAEHRRQWERAALGTNGSVH